MSWPFCFSIKAEYISRQAFVMMNISCEFENCTYKTLFSTKLHTGCQNNSHGGDLVLQNEVKNIPRQDFIMMNISCKFENCTYNTFPLEG